MVKRTAVVAVALICMLGLASASTQKATVLRVVVVKTDNLPQYLDELEKGKEMRKRLGMPGQVRIWRARYAGPDAGAVVVSVEYPSMAAFAAEEAKISASSEYQAWLKGLDRIRTVVSESLYGEL